MMFERLKVIAQYIFDGDKDSIASLLKKLYLSSIAFTKSLGNLLGNISSAWKKTEEKREDK